MAASSARVGAFDMIIPSASTFVASSSSGTKQTPYDVFINHCGQDVKLTLATSIHKALDAKGLKVFLDKPELDLGVPFPKAIQDAMDTSSIYIAIFSEHYAQSPWCLAELVHMVQSSKTIIPIFYHVQPYVLRWADGVKGAYADAFSKHENDKRYAPGLLQQWKEALQQVSFRNGRIINNIDDEQRMVKEVVNRVMKEMNKVPLDVANHPVGLDEAVQDFETTIALDHQSAGSTKTRTVGIWGMGGSGKTTLAKEIFNRRHCSMHWSSFLSDIPDAHMKDKLLDKQKTLLKDLDRKDKCDKCDLDPKDKCEFDNLDEGKQILKNRLSRSVPVLIVLDDVDDINQLDDLLPPKESLGDRTLIIVTTRNKNVLQQWGMSDSAIYQMKRLDPIHSKQLFCSYAFSGNSLPPEVEDLVEKFLKACNGLPLSLKVLGGQLCGKSGKDYWEDTWNKYSQIPHTDIKKRLKVSYDALEKEEQEMFLDAACLFIGQRKSAAIAAWDAEFYGRLGWDTLIKKCLVEEEEVGEEVLIRMHDHLRDLGREIANEQPAHRLWSPHQAIKITSQQESLRVRGIAQAVGDICYHRQGKIVIKTKNQEECSLPPSSLERLKFFAGNGEFFSQGLSNLSKELIWLQCHYIYQSTDLRSCPALKKLRCPALKKLRILEVSDYGTQELGLWADVPSELRELVSWEFDAGFPRSIDHAKYLKRIVINGNYSASARDLPTEFCNLIWLEHLELTSWLHLSSLPSNFGNLTKLRHLNLSYCVKLKALPDSFKKLTLLEYLMLRSCEKLSMNSELNVLENMTKLRYLNLRGCERLEDIRLPESGSLTDLHLLQTGLKELPANIFHLSKLTKLEIGSKSLTTFPICEGKSLPDCLEHLSLLKDLTLEDTGVKCLPLKSLIHLQGLRIVYTPLSELSLRSCCMLERIKLKGTEVAQISIGGDSCPALETLELYGNYDLRELEILPEKLKTLDIEYCKSLKDIKGVRGLKELKSMKIRDCEDLKELPCFAELTSLEYLKISDCPISAGLQGLAKLTSLKQMVLRSCKLEKIEGLEHLKSLERFKIIDCPELKVLPSLPETAPLREFYLEGCNKLEKVGGLGNVRSLEKLTIRNCPELKVLPSLPETASRREFYFEGCNKLEKVERLGNVRSLEKLTIGDCPELTVFAFLSETAPTLEEIHLRRWHKLQRLEGLKNIRSLKKLRIYDCPELNGLPGLAELTSLQEIDLRMCPKLKKIEGLGNMRSLETLNISDCLEVEKIEGLEQLSYLRKLKVHTRWEAPCIVSLANSERLRSLEVVANNISAVEPFVSNIQKCTRKVMICTKAVRDVGFLKSFFQSFPNVSVLDYHLSARDYHLSARDYLESQSSSDVEDESEGQYSDTDVEDVDFSDESDFDPTDESKVELWAPMSSAKAKAILKCFIIETHHSDLRFSVQVEEGPYYAKFNTELGEGKWVWMGVFTQRRDYYSVPDTDLIFARDRKGKNVKVRVEAAWLVMGEEGSIVEAFRQHFQRVSKNVTSGHGGFVGAPSSGQASSSSKGTQNQGVGGDRKSSFSRGNQDLQQRGSNPPALSSGNFSNSRDSRNWYQNRRNQYSQPTASTHSFASGGRFQQSSAPRGSGGFTGYCFSCGQHGHKATHCPSRGSGGFTGDCFSCGQRGHKAAHCPQRET